MTPTANIINPIADNPHLGYAASLADSRGVQLISRATAVLVLLLAFAAFLMSFDALHELAAKSGAIAPRFSAVFPLAVDGAIIVFSISALRASLCGEATRVPMALVIAVTSLSVVLNIAHAPFGILSCVMAATPPMLLFLSFESLMRQMRSEMGRRGAVASMGELAQRHSEALGRLEALHAKERSLERQIASLSENRKSARAARGKGKGTSTTEGERRERVAKVRELSGDGAGSSRIAEELGVSKATVRRDLREVAEMEEAA